MFRVLCVSLGMLLFSVLPQAALLKSPILSAPQAVAAETAAPTTISPTGVITPLRMVTFEWRAQPEAAWYYLWISTPSGSGLNQWYFGEFICQFEVCAATPGLPIEAGLYRWWVKAWSPVTGYSEWSSETQYIVTTAAPLLTAPSGALNTFQPTFQWYASPNASWYYIWLSGPDGFVVSQWFPATNCFAGMCVMSPLLLPPGEYRWWLQAWQEQGGYSPWSEPLTFTIADDVTIPPPPDGVDPTEEVTVEPTLAPTEEVTAAPTAAPTEATATVEPTTETPAPTVEAATPTPEPTTETPVEVTPETTATG